jgi:hypothetical protein
LGSGSRRTYGLRRVVVDGLIRGEGPEVGERGGVLLAWLEYDEDKSGG